MDAVKVVTFDDGSNIITRITELRDKEGNSICFQIRYPFSLASEQDESGDTKVRFGPYNIYTQDTEIRIPFNAVRTITNPKQFIYEKYLEVIAPFDPVYAEKMLTEDPTNVDAPAAVENLEPNE
jgi:hypothetical protein